MAASTHGSSRVIQAAQADRLFQLELARVQRRLVDEDMRVDYQKALDLYEQAKQRFRRACVLARRDGSELPARLPPCFFNPQHGPSVSELGWPPPGGVERAVPVCRRDLNRMRDNLMPDLRVVRIGGHFVPWYAAGSADEALEGSVDSHAVTEGKRSAQASYALYVGPDQNGLPRGGMFDNF